MRLLLICTLALVALTGSALAADVFVPPPPAHVMVAPPPPVYAPPPPRYSYYPRPPVVAYGPPPGLITVPGGPSYYVQQPAYQAGSEYVAGPLEVEGPGYRRECWFEWGQRRCVLRPGWQ